MFKRSHTCGELTLKEVGDDIALNGWVNSTRDHGGLIFIDLRDRYGITQLTFNEEINSEAFTQTKKLSMEDVISVKGEVIKRDVNAIRKEISSGEIEVEVSELIILNESKPLPFLISDRESASEETRLKYRYLELRTEEMQKNMTIRHRAYQSVRNYLSGHKFMEFETPVLMRATPEGARDFLVPSRLHKGKFYALPQSPQQYKQILMVSGYDRYFQIVKCFRDEDFRADRQPEFTQIDIEMSFIDEEDIRQIVEGLVTTVMNEVLGENLKLPFPIISYDEAMNRYGSDKPDIRFDLSLVDFSIYTERSNLETLQTADVVKAIIIPKADSFSRKVIDQLTLFVKEFSSQEKKIPITGLGWMKYSENDLVGGISKFFHTELKREMIKSLNISEGDLVLVAGGERETVLSTMGALRLDIAQRQQLINPEDFKPLWVSDYPLFDWDGDNNNWTFLHHPFTSPAQKDMKNFV